MHVLKEKKDKKIETKILQWWSFWTWYSSFV